MSRDSLVAFVSLSALSLSFPDLPSCNVFVALPSSVALPSFPFASSYRSPDWTAFEAPATSTGGSVACFWCSWNDS
eukprot:Skav233374  [mRNA]  locus=scaffold1038:44241:46288:- [translate_table: standard]